MSKSSNLRTYYLPWCQTNAEVLYKYQYLINILKKFLFIPISQHNWFPSAHNKNNTEDKLYIEVFWYSFVKFTTGRCSLFEIKTGSIYRQAGESYWLYGCVLVFFKILPLLQVM